GGPLATFLQQVNDLIAQRTNLDRRIHQAGGADDLLDHHALTLVQLILRGGRRDEDRLRNHFLELAKLQRSVVQRGGKAKTVLDQRLLARSVAAVHRADLRNRLVALGDEDEEILRVGVEQARGRLPRRAPGEVARVILDPVAESKLLDHLQVEQRALLEALGFHQSVL